jgi:glycosyltransferase involved in cell wall biosynthesis
VLLGDGPLRGALNSQLSTLNLHQHVHLPGFKQYEELPVYYALAKAFVHPSTTEQWGLVVNEAIASGLPVIVSERCGCVPELIGDNGFTFDPLSEDALTARLLDMASLSDYDLERLREASRGIATRFGPELFGKGLEDASRTAIENTPKKFGVRDRAILLAAARIGR